MLAAAGAATPAEQPWASAAGDVAAGLGVDPARGLDPAEAAARLARHGPNVLREAAREPAWRRLLAQFTQPLVYLLLAAVVVSLTAWVLDGARDVPTDAVVITAILLLNGVLGYVQEARAEAAVAALRRLGAVEATALRDGRRTRVPAADLVPGDVLVLAEGDAVSADARVLTAAGLTVAEAALTGESEPVHKDPAEVPDATGLADRTGMVFSGTAVVRGHGTAVVTATGMQAELGAIAGLIERVAPPRTPLQLEVERIGRALGIAVLAISVIVAAAIATTADIDSAADAVDVLLVAVALAVAAVPEGLPAILSVVLALGVQRMARRNAIVRRLASVETLGAATVICADKTGTLTRNQMTVETVVADGDEQGVLSAACLASHTQPGQAGGDPTELALLAAERDPEPRRARFERVAEIPFSSESKMMTVIARDRDEGGYVAVTKGAPDVLLARCALSAERRAELLAEATALADRSLRVIGVAHRGVADATPSPDAQRDLVHLGMVGMLDPPRAEAPAAVAEAQAAGIRVVMITGDHPRTARRIARDIGIAGGRVVTGDEIDALADAELCAASVFARVTPAHKLRIVAALQAAGEVVAMTGDGVNDAPALRAADIGIAMGRGGTEVAKEAADMVLADDDFATIVAAVREGRAIYADIRRFLRFLLSSNLGEVLTMFAAAMLAAPLGLEVAGSALAVPLLATQILWVNLLTDAAPALALGVDPPPAQVMQVAPRSRSAHVIDRDMWIRIAGVGAVTAIVTLAALEIVLRGGSGDITEARTAAFTTLVLSQLFNALNARSGRHSAFRRLFTNRLLWAALALSAALQVAAVQLHFLNHAFSTVPLSIGQWGMCIALASVVLWAVELAKLIRRGGAAPSGAARRLPTR